MFFDRFDICQAYMQLEHDYNEGGILWDRPSCARRRESVGVQLCRLQFHPGARWVEIDDPDPDTDDVGDENVRAIFIAAAARMGLPFDAALARTARRLFVQDWCDEHHIPAVEEDHETARA